MTLKDIPEGTLLKNIKVRLPEDVYLNSSLPEFYGIETREVFLVGPMMGDVFVSLEHGGDKKQIYPLFMNSFPDNVLDWEVIEIISI